MAEPIAPPRKLKYIPAFDGIRGLFCLIIISHHLPVHYSRVPFAFGWEILQLFFVMSGYLITSILLKDKNYPLFLLYLFMHFCWLFYEFK